MPSKAELKERLVAGHVLTEQDVHDIIDVAGKPGKPGQNGADGFVTEEQYKDIISRLNKLENPEEPTE